MNGLVKVLEKFVLHVIICIPLVMIPWTLHDFMGISIFWLITITFVCGAIYADIIRWVDGKID